MSVKAACVLKSERNLKYNKKKHNVLQKDKNKMLAINQEVHYYMHIREYFSCADDQTK